MKIAVLVSNDLVFDQRVKKTCDVLISNGHKPVLIGRELPDSSSYSGPGSAVRFKMNSNSGFRFYLELQRRLISWLRTADIEAIWANDLDTLLPALIIGRRRGLPVVYDSHEFFTEAAGLTGKPLRRLVWLMIEKYTVPRIGRMLTVNKSIAEKFRGRYSVEVGVLRNMPVLSDVPSVNPREPFSKYNVPTDKPILLLQGAFMDRDRGTSDAVDALVVMKDVTLVLVGAGVEWEESLDRIDDARWRGRLFCIPRLPYGKLRELTAAADVGLSLDKALHENYQLSLPNKLFDFIHVGLPIVASPMVEVKRIVEDHNVGVVIQEVTSQAIASAVEKVLSTPRDQWFNSCMIAREKLHWGVDSHLIQHSLEQALLQPWVNVK
jgi:glycosyltransferase involved in cell wall biosynthesis